MIYPASTLYPGNTDAYPSFVGRPWSFNGTASASYGGTIAFTYNTDEDWTYAE